MSEFELSVRACLADPGLTYRQRVQALALLAENALPPPVVSEDCTRAQAKAVVHDMGEGNAPYRPRYVLPDYATALARGSAHLELEAPTTLDDALTFLLAMYAGVPSITGYPVYLGDLDRLLEPFVGPESGVGDAELDAALTRFWRVIDRTMPDAFVHANLGPDDGRVVRSILRVDAAQRQIVPNLTLRVDPERTPEDLLRAAVQTTCADGKPHYVNDPMMRADLGQAYGVVSCYNSLPYGGGAHTLVRLDLSASLRFAEVPAEDWLERSLPRHVELTAELMAARIRHLVEQTGFYRHDWLAREGLISLDRFTAMFGFFGLAEAVELAGVGGGGAGYGRDERATAFGHRIVARLAELVAATPLPYCEATGGHALLHAHSGIDSDIGVTAGARIPVGCEPPLYQHIRAVAPNHRHVPAGISDVFRFEPTVGANPDAVVAVLRGAFAEGMRDVTFDVVGNGFVRITGFLVREQDVAGIAADGRARHASSFLGAGSMVNQRLSERVVKAAPGGTDQALAGPAG